MPHNNPAFPLVSWVSKLGAFLCVAAMLASCSTGGLEGQNASSPSASVGNQGAGAGSSIQNVPANPGSVPNGAGAFPANAGGGPR